MTDYIHCPACFRDVRSDRNYCEWCGCPIDNSLYKKVIIETSNDNLSKEEFSNNIADKSSINAEKTSINENVVTEQNEEDVSINENVVTEQNDEQSYNSELLLNNSLVRNEVTYNTNTISNDTKKSNTKYVIVILILIGIIIYLLFRGDNTKNSTIVNGTAQKNDNKPEQVYQNSNSNNNHSSNQTYNNYNNSSNNTDPLFQVEIIKIVNIRSSPTTKKDNKIGITSEGQIHDVYEIVNNEGYTWYKIDSTSDIWIADDGTWTSRLDSNLSGNGVNTQSKGHYENVPVVIQEAWTEEIMISPAWEEQVLVTPGYWAEETECVSWTQTCEENGQCSEPECYETKTRQYWVNDVYETIYHDAEYTTVYHDAVIEYQEVWVND